MGVAGLVLAGALVGLWTPDLDSHALEQTYATPHTQFLVMEGQRVHYQDSGPSHAPVIVLLHGFGSSLQTWSTWVDSLNKTYRVISLDLPGFGLTGPNSTHAYTDADDVQFVENFVNQLQIDQFTLVGHSMGGKIAWNVAATHPSKVQQLILIAPDGYSKPQELGMKPYALPAWSKLMQYCLPRFLVKKSLEPAFYDADAMTEDLLTRYHDFLRAPGVRQAIIDRANQTINTDPVERLKKITAPTLLLWGAADQMIPSDNAQQYARVLTNSSTVVLPEQGHLLQEERPQEGLAEVLAFLNRGR
jgi:pimeloyl-ACP methyl ester carboxylesterase